MAEHKCNISFKVFKVFSVFHTPLNRYFFDEKILRKKYIEVYFGEFESFESGLEEIILPIEI
jgi:hypothetical protein